MGVLQDLIDGTVSSRMTIHLGTQRQAMPFTLGGLVEATFAGYQPSPLTGKSQTELASGWSVLNCTSVFQNSGSVPLSILTAWLTAETSQGDVVLVSVISLANPFEVNVVGYFSMAFQFLVYQNQEGGS